MLYLLEDSWREILRTYSIPYSTHYQSETGRHFRLPVEGEEDCP
jgi:hypothetical protein